MTKEVTICFSYSCSATVAKSSFTILDILAGLCTGGIKDSVGRRLALRDVFSLLEKITWHTDDFYIKCVALSERKQANKPDDLKPKM